LKPVTAVAEQVETFFRRIQGTRMRDIPILNAALSVAAVDFRRYQAHWLGALVTPWTINLMLLPATTTGKPPIATGTTRTVAFPAGDFEFIAGHEPGIGAYEACSLYSPVTEFADQATAVATARSAIGLLLDSRLADLEDISVETPSTSPRGVTRRELLRGRLQSHTA